MYGATWGEAISPGAAGFECRGSYWCENPVRVAPSGGSACRVRGRGQAKTDRYSGAPVNPVTCDWVCEARGRSQGRNPWQGQRRNTLGGWKPKGAASGWRVKPRSPPGTPGRVKAQEPRPVGPAHRFGGGKTDGWNGTWVLPPRKRSGYLPRGGSSEGWIPRAPPVWNKTGRGSEGVSRREGNQTLRTERSGQAKPVWVDLRSRECCRERKPMRGVGWLRPAG